MRGIGSRLAGGDFGAAKYNRLSLAFSKKKREIISNQVNKTKNKKSTPKSAYRLNNNLSCNAT